METNVIIQGEPTVEQKRVIPVLVYKGHEPTFKTCLTCGEKIRVIKCLSKRKKFCSRRCSDQSKKQPPVKLSCLNCQKPLLYNPSHRTKLPYCSKVCQHSHMKGINSPSWEGGIKTVTQANGTKRVYINIGYTAKKYKGHPGGMVKWRSKARVLVEHEIGRPLKRTELIWNINGDTMDDRLENLYVFPSISAKNKAFYGFHSEVPAGSNIKELAKDSMDNKVTILSTTIYYPCYCRDCQLIWYVKNPDVKQCRRCKSANMNVGTK